MKRNRKTIIWYVFGFLLVFVISTLIIDYQHNSKYEILPMRPEETILCEQDQVYADLVNDSADIDWNRLDGTLQYIRSEYDCSDFRMVNLIRILYEYGDRIPEAYLEKIENVLFNFRYWWDEPGENSMCYWSENHQILFASAEYLVGQLYPDMVFTVSGLSGRDHMAKARERAMDWLQMRWGYGFIEFYSSVYYKEDIGALINLIDFATDDELSQKSRIIMDLLMFDVATQSLQTRFSSVSGRAYERNRIGKEAAGFSGLTSYYWGDRHPVNIGLMYGMMLSGNYTPPPVMKEIATDTATVVIKQSNGLDLSELKTEGYYGTDNRSMMMQWGMEAFTNPEVVRNSLAHVRSCNMFTNAFLGDFTILNYRILDWLHLEPVLVRLLDPQTNGVAIQKGNTYTYRTGDFSMSTAQAHHPGEYADQQHVFGMNLGAFSIFHTHPAMEKDVEHQSPNYWVGYGHFPHSVQDLDVNLSLYRIPEKKGPMEAALLDYTRAYFPVAEFDSAFIDSSYAFGKKGDVYVALIGSQPFSFRDEDRDDLIQPGNRSFWITEAGSPEEDGSFDDFVTRIRDNQVRFDPETMSLNYHSGPSEYNLVFGKDFMVNGEVVDTRYRRYDSPYAQHDRKAETITIERNGEKLFLDFENDIRIY